MTENIKNKTVFALKWVSAMQVLTIAGQLLIRLIIASILLPDEIGLIAIITVITEVIVMAADMGFNASVIQRKNLNNKHISTAFFVNMLFAFILTGVIIITSGTVSNFFGDYRMQELLQIISLVIIIRASVSVQIGICDRNLNFKKIVIATTIGLVLSSILKIMLAKDGYGAKSIVYGDIVNHGIIATYLWLSTKWLPSIRLISKKAFRELFSFGGNIMLVNTLNHLSSKVDVMFVGKLIGTFAAGIFSIAFMIANMLVSVMNSVIQRVFFPSFSLIQDNQEKLKNGYLNATKYISLAGVPICVGIFFTAPEFVRFFLNESWQPAILIIQILSVKSLMNSLGGILWGQILKAKGMSGLVLKLTIVKLIALFIFIYLGSLYGLTGIAVASAIYSMIFRFVYQHIINKIINISMIQYIRSLVPAFINAFIMSVILGLIKIIFTVYPATDIVEFVILGLTGFLSYILVFKLFFKSDFKEIVNMIKMRI